MSLSKFCGFCDSAGERGPHDHFLRITKDPRSAVCCPKLLATECAGCGKFGHTIKYCGELKFSQQLAKQAQSNANKNAFMNGGWCSPSRSSIIKPLASPPPLIPKIKQNKYAAIEMLSEDEESDDEDDAGDEKFYNALAADCAGGDEETWAQIVQRNGLEHILQKRLAKAGPESPGLPPPDQIVWGKFGATKWAEA